MQQSLYLTLDKDMMTVTVDFFSVFPVLSLVWCTFVVTIDILQNIFTSQLMTLVTKASICQKLRNL